MPRTLLPLALAAVLAAACQSSPTPDPRFALASEVERIAELLEQDRPCRALDVAEALPVQDEGLDAPVRDAVGGFVTDLHETIQCPAPGPSPTATGTPTPRETEPAPPGDGGNDGGNGDDGDDEGDDDEGNDDEGKGNGNGGDDDDGGPPPGRGNNGPGNGDGPGRGND